MRQSGRLMRPRLAIATLGACLALSALAAGNAPRFSQALTTDERAEIGISRLSSDETAVLDALVRRDTAVRAGTDADGSAPAAFSQRLTADERRIAGFGHLAAEEIARLDTAVERHGAASLARTLLAPPAFVRRPSLDPTETKEPRRFRGTYFFSLGFGSGGYSEKTGGMTVTMDDPAGRYSITIGYAESHIKGGHGHGVYRDYGPGFHRPTLPDGSMLDGVNR